MHKTKTPRRPEQGLMRGGLALARPAGRQTRPLLTFACFGTSRVPVAHGSAGSPLAVPPAMEKWSGGFDGAGAGDLVWPDFPDLIGQEFDDGTVGPAADSRPVPDRESDEARGHQAAPLRLAWGMVAIMGTASREQTAPMRKAGMTWLSINRRCQTTPATRLAINCPSPLTV